MPDPVTPERQDLNQAVGQLLDYADETEHGSPVRIEACRAAIFAAFDSLAAQVEELTEKNHLMMWLMWQERVQMRAVIEAAREAGSPHTHPYTSAAIPCRRCKLDTALAALDAEKP